MRWAPRRESRGRFASTTRSTCWPFSRYFVARHDLTVKDNHPHLYEDVQWLFEQHEHEPDWRQETQGHGRQETREAWLLSDLAFLAPSERLAWRDLHAVVKIRATRRVDGRVSVKDRYFLTSHTDVTKVAYAVRSHWGIENGLHWVLDIAFDEDHNRARMEHAQANLVTARHLALSLLKQETSERISLKAKRKRAGWDEAYLLKVLNT